MEMRNKAQDDEENFSSRLWRKLSLANWEIMFLRLQFLYYKRSVNEWKKFDKAKGRKRTVKVALFCVRADTLRLTSLQLTIAGLARILLWGVAIVHAWKKHCPSNCFTVWLFKRETIVHF